MIRAYISDDRFTGFGVSVAIVQHPPEGSMDMQPRILHYVPYGDGGQLRQSWDEIEEAAPLVEPTVRLDADSARALLEGLTRHYHGADDTRALRQDYDAERKRVDTFSAALIRLAETLAVQPVVEVEPRRQGRVL